MDKIKEQQIREKVRRNIKEFVYKFETRYMKELNDPTVILKEIMHLFLN